MRRDVCPPVVERELPPQLVVLGLPREARHDGPELPRHPLGRIRPFEHDVEVARTDARPLACTPEALALVAHQCRVDDHALDAEQLERRRQVTAREHRDLRARQRFADALEQGVQPEGDVAESAVPVDEAPPRAARRGAREDPLELVAPELAENPPDHRSSSSSIAAATGATSIACMQRGAGHSCGPRVQCFSQAISRLKSSR